MPTTTAAAKAFRQNVKARARNKSVRDHLKKLQVRLRKAIAAKQVEPANSALREFIRALDKAAQKKIITRNTAARKKARAARAIKTIKG